MFTAEELCKKGFYGVEMGIADLKTRKEALDVKDTEIVTADSVQKVKRGRDPSLFRYPSSALEPVYHRATSHKFMSFVTKERFRFNCPDYYFIFHELLVAPAHALDCNGLRRTLGIGAKSFFYFVKKLSQLRLVHKKDNTVSLVHEEAYCREKEPAASMPLCFLMNVPVYKQVLDMLHTAEQGVSTYDLKEVLGMDTKQGLHVLKKIKAETPGIATHTEFEGKIKRLKYVLKQYHEKKKNETSQRMARGEEPALSNSVSTDIRAKVIENIILERDTVILNKHFQDLVRDALGTSHSIERNTILNSVAGSQRVSAVKVFVRQNTKTISRYVLRRKDIPETDQRVVQAVASQGYISFSIVTPTGILDYSMEKRDGLARDAPAHSPPSAAPIKALRHALHTQYDKISSAEKHGYIPDAEQRLGALRRYVEGAGLRGAKPQHILELMPVSLFFSLFLCQCREVPGTVRGFYEERGIDWRGVAYGTAIQELKPGITKHLTCAAHIKRLRQYLVQIQRKSAPPEPATPETRLGEVGTPERDAILSAVSEEYARTVQAETSGAEQMSDHDLKHVCASIAVDHIRRSRHTAEEKRTLMRLVKQVRRKPLPLRPRVDIAEISLHRSDQVRIYHRIYSPSEISGVFFELKQRLEGGSLDLLSELLNLEYILLEQIVWALHHMGVLELARESVCSGNACIAPVSYSGAYLERRKGPGMPYASIFSISSPFPISGTMFTPGSKVPSRSDFTAAPSTSESTAVSPTSEPRPVASILEFTAMCLFRQLVHFGTASAAHVLSRLPFLSLFEVEWAAESYPEVFRVTRTGPPCPSSVFVSLQEK